MTELRLQLYLRSFEKIVEAYKVNEPLARFLTGYFKTNRQMGSKDRRIASQLIYNYFRLGNSLAALPVTKRIALAEFLCTSSSEIVELLEPDLVPFIGNSLDSKIDFLSEKYGFSIQSVFPLGHLISEKIKKDEFLKSHFIQPDLFIRIHKGEEKRVRAGLRSHDIPYEELSEQSLRLANGTQLNRINLIQGKYEVQDINSQRTASLFKAEPNEAWWDACAASGGKTILLKESQPSVNLLVSDIRNSILRNLDERLGQAGIKEYRRKIIDLTNDSSQVLGTELFDGIIVDAPCSGSGTWGRTPEGMVMFSEENLKRYTKLQSDILRNVVKHIKPGKPIIYITCSVFKQENETQVEMLQTRGFRLEEMHYFQGADLHADTLFAARLIAP